MLTNIALTTEGLQGLDAAGSMLKEADLVNAYADNAEITACYIADQGELVLGRVCVWFRALH
jgi:hypothetical protein